LSLVNTAMALFWIAAAATLVGRAHESSRVRTTNDASSVAKPSTGSDQAQSEHRLQQPGLDTAPA
jgi:hypothetical protein